MFKHSSKYTWVRWKSKSTFKDGNKSEWKAGSIFCGGADVSRPWVELDKQTKPIWDWDWLLIIWDSTHFGFRFGNCGKNHLEWVCTIRTYCFGICGLVQKFKYILWVNYINIWSKWPVLGRGPSAGYHYCGKH